jgi:hypothetical protein
MIKITPALFIQKKLKPPLFFKKIFAYMRELFSPIQAICDESFKKYLVLRLQPNTISYHLVNNGDITEEHVFDITDIKKLPMHIEHLADMPVHIILGSWALKIKNLDLHKINYINRYYLRKEFYRGEYDPKDLVKSETSSLNSDIYHFVGIAQNYTLDQALMSLMSINNSIMATSIEEELFIHYINKELSHFHKDWFIIFLEEHKKWKLIVARGNDMVLCREGEVPKTIDNISRYCVQEVLDTIRYLPKFGYKKNQRMALFFDKKSFKKDDFDKKEVLLCPLTDLNYSKLYKPKFDHLQTKLKRWGHLDFFKTKLSIPYFFWHRVLYSLPRHVVQVFLPIFLFSLVGCAIYGIKYYYYYYQNLELISSIKQIEDNISKTKNANQIRLFNSFKSDYQKNPILQIRHVAEGLKTILSAQHVQWEAIKNQIKITLTIDKKHLKGKKNIAYIKKKIERFISQKIEDIKIQWTEDDKNNLLLILISEAK